MGLAPKPLTAFQAKKKKEALLDKYRELSAEAENIYRELGTINTAHSMIVQNPESSSSSKN